MEKDSAPKPVASVLGKAPNWYHSGVMGIDETLGIIYYCAEELVFALDASDLSYLAAWPAHIKRTNCLAVSSSPNGPSLATGGSDKVVRLWAPKIDSKGLSNKQEVLFEHRLHKADIRAVQWSSDNQTVISDKAATPATNRQRMLREK
ncbi:hypothetical protein DSO57_1033590 [Entomophthora muscae]|uniref:Uncharacterized protein n=1 Tax=Entomophthora muscae TaxID=34485 RepID=A0ACC2SNZ4_9FUNG|nr:hypothetical protein DSO57_1033590 [Entomophthora muscae]